MRNNNQADETEQDKRKKRNDLQREIIMSETELRKVANEKRVIEAELSRFKRDIDDLRSNMQEKQKRLQKIEQDAMMKQVEINKLKKQLNLI
jgi:peptidoglycan hydrolase CwlO-like protein